METRYYKKYDTTIRLNTSVGYAVPFEQIKDDKGRLFEWGVLATNEAYLINELDGFIQRQSGGVAEVGKAEYEALKKKLNQTLSPSWRDTISLPWLKKQYLLAQEKLAAGVEFSIPDVVRTLRAESRDLSRRQGVNTFRPKGVAR